MKHIIGRKKLPCHSPSIIILPLLLYCTVLPPYHAIPIPIHFSTLRIATLEPRSDLSEPYSSCYDDNDHNHTRIVDTNFPHPSTQASALEEMEDGKWWATTQSPPVRTSRLEKCFAEHVCGAPGFCDLTRLLLLNPVLVLVLVLVFISVSAFASAWCYSAAPFLCIGDFAWSARLGLGCGCFISEACMSGLVCTLWV